MLRSDYPLPKEVETWVNAWLSKHPTKEIHAVRMAGDGSTRSFYRLTGGGSAWILLQDPDWVTTQDYPAHQRFLKDRGIKVPEFLATDPKAHCILMQDLGDALLQTEIQKSPTSRMNWLRRATVTLAELHGKTYPVPADLPASTRRFDKKKYFEELQWTLTHLHQGYLKLPQASKKTLEKLEAYCERIENYGPFVFCHRDYHTRNILNKDGALFLIDFQDARLGPPHYDIASLLYDAYVQVSDAERGELITLYREAIKNYPTLNSKIDWTQFPSELAAVAFQRTVKAAGSFASFFTRFGKRTHLPYLLPALRSAVSLESLSVDVAGIVDDCLALKDCIAMLERQE